MNIVLFSEKDKDEKEDEFIFFKNDERYGHIKKVLNLKTGDKFKAGIVNGKIGEALIENFDESKLLFKFYPLTNAEPLYPVNIILGFPRPIQLRRILRALSSMGLAKIFLTGTELGEKSYMSSSLSKKSEIEKYLLDGCAQAGNPVLPDVFSVSSVKNFFSTFSEDIKLSVNKFIFDVDKGQCKRENADFSIKDSDSKGLDGGILPVWIAVGSERGWTSDERNQFHEHGFRFKSLGNRILRTETAAAAAAAYVFTKLNFYP